MTDQDEQQTLRRRADLTFAGLLGVGLTVWVLVAVLTGNLALGILYGLLPGVALGLLGRLRILRGGLINRPSTQDSEDRGPA